jgi:hypothetical protein
VPLYYQLVLGKHLFLHLGDPRTTTANHQSDPIIIVVEADHDKLNNSGIEA